MNNNPSSTNKNFDLKSMMLIALGQFTPWLVVVIFATWASYPGIVCLTPMAWLIALNVGILCMRQSKSVLERRLLEASLAGAILGLLQGLLFIFIIPMMGPIQDGEMKSTFTLSIFMLIGGSLVSAGLSYISAVLVKRKQVSQ